MNKNNNSAGLVDDETVAKTQEEPDVRLYIWNVNGDRHSTFENMKQDYLQLKDEVSAQVKQLVQSQSKAATNRQDQN